MTSDEMLDKREDVLDEFDDRVDLSHGVMTLGEQRWFTAQLLADEIVRLRRILAALREPSEAFIDTVVRFGYSHFHGMPIQPANFLRAAVAAAEKEVGDA